MTEKNCKKLSLFSLSCNILHLHCQSKSSSDGLLHLGTVLGAGVYQGRRDAGSGLGWCQDGLAGARSQAAGWSFHPGRSDDIGTRVPPRGRASTGSTVSPLWSSMTPSQANENENVNVIYAPCFPPVLTQNYLWISEEAIHEFMNCLISLFLLSSFHLFLLSFLFGLVSPPKDGKKQE